MVSCVHHVPGRARFKFRAMLSDESLVEQVRREVLDVDGVISVDINRGAASVIVHYCPDRGEMADIVERMCAQCPYNTSVADAAPPAPAAAGARSGEPTAPPRLTLPPKVKDAMGEAVSKALVNTLINRAVERGLSSVFLGR